MRHDRRSTHYLNLLPQATSTALPYDDDKKKRSDDEVRPTQGDKGSSVAAGSDGACSVDDDGEEEREEGFGSMLSCLFAMAALFIH